MIYERFSRKKLTRSAKVVSSFPKRVCQVIHPGSGEGYHRLRRVYHPKISKGQDHENKEGIRGV